MTSARELAIEVLPHFERAVLAGHVYAYGHYASAIGRSSETESMIIGKAMHAIGAVCVLAKIPIAPLHFVRRADGEWRGVFESNTHERIHVLPHYNLLYVTARDYKYTTSDFARVRKALADVLPKYLPSDQLSPHDIWRWALHAKLKDGRTPWELALARYRELFASIKDARRNSTSRRGDGA
jgi:hypothetical protein